MKCTLAYHVTRKAYVNIINYWIKFRSLFVHHRVLAESNEKGESSETREE
jgi:hypothetical protein